MPTIDAHDPGTICWIDLASTDATGATEFYCELFGWTAAEPIENAGGYRMLLCDDKQVAGLAPCWGDTDRSSWSAYIASADVDATCAAALANGGEVVMEAMDVLDAGRMAIVRDPAGAQVSLWQPGEHRGFELHREPGAPMGGELVTRDLGQAAAFYRAVFGWTAQTGPPGGAHSAVWSFRDEPVGGVLVMDATWPEDTPPHWLVSFATEDPDATARRCGELGGAVRQPPSGTGSERLALLEDPAGAAFAVVALRG